MLIWKTFIHFFFECDDATPLRNFELWKKIAPLVRKDFFVYKYTNLQIVQLPQEDLSFLQNLLNFIITKYLKQEVEDDLNIWVDECSPCGLSIIGDIKIYQCYVIKR